jgi:hypothetical protein
MGSWYEECRIGKPLNLGEVCFLLRSRYDVSLVKLGRLLGVSHMTMIQWERGRPGVSRYWDFWASLGWKLPEGAEFPELGQTTAEGRKADAKEKNERQRDARRRKAFKDLVRGG